MDDETGGYSGARTGGRAPMPEETLTRRVIECFFAAYNGLGFGLPESVYSSALDLGNQLPLGSRSQLISYLRISKKQVGLLLCFGPTPEIQRVTL